MNTLVCESLVLKRLGERILGLHHWVSTPGVIRCRHYGNVEAGSIPTAVRNRIVSIRACVVDKRLLLPARFGLNKTE